MTCISAHLGDKIPFNQIYRIIAKDGHYLWVSVNFNTFNLNASRYLYAVYTDISEFKKQEQQLEEQYDAAQAFIDSVARNYLMTIRANLAKNILEEIKGTGRFPSVSNRQEYDLCIERFLQDVPDKQMREACNRFFSRESLLSAYENGTKKLSKEFQYPKGDGEIIWVRCVITLSRRPDSNDVILFSAISDINEEKIREAIMNQVVTKQYDYLSCVNTKTGKIVLFLSNDDQVDDAVTRQGSDYDKAMRMYNRAYVRASEQDDCIAFMTMENVRRVLDSTRRCVATFNVDEGGGPCVKQVEFFYIDRKNNLIALVRTDITEAQRQQMNQEEKLRQALNAAQQANAAKSEFLSRMSHDIRTPLNGIIGITYLAKELDHSPQMMDYLQKIDVSSQFLLGLINDVLDMSKVESGMLELYPEPYNPKDFFAYLDSVIRPLCDEKNVKFVIDAKPISGFAALMDPLRINQIFFNLLSNAVKFTPAGGTVICRMRTTRIGENRLSVVCEVSDTGIGISEKFQKILFEPFAQENRDDVSQSRGTGLGLAITKRIIDAMHGSISVKSKVGEGTTFTVEFEVDAVPIDTLKETEQPAVALLKREHLLEGRHVLLCEDHPLNQEIARTLLERKKMKVDVAENGGRGLELFSRSPVGYYDVVLMDIRMPVMDGYQTTVAIRGLDRPDAQKIPIIAMTADAFENDVKKCFDVGMNGHVAKPIDPELLLDELARFFEEKK